MRLARKQFRSNLKHIFGLACVLSISATIKKLAGVAFFHFQTSCACNLGHSRSVLDDGFVEERVTLNCKCDSGINSLLGENCNILFKLHASE